MRGPATQTGGIGTVALVILALIGAMTVGLVTLGVLHWEGRTPVVTAAAETAETGKTEAPGLRAGSAPHELPADLQGDYDRSCRVCHNIPGTGAPQAGNAQDWQPRLAQGLDGLLEHTVSGFQGMPPMGMCMHCSREAFTAFIAYMAQIDVTEECAQ